MPGAERDRAESAESAESSEPGSPGPIVRALWPQLLTLGAVLAAALAADPIRRSGSHLGRLLLALAALLLIHGMWRARELWPGFSPFRDSLAQGARGRVGRLLSAAAAGLCLLAAFNYYQFDRRVFGTVGDYADSTYYYLNSKYFEELGYTRLYAAMLAADEEGGQRFEEVPRYRDLVAYEHLLPRAHALAEADELRSHFAPERWQAFVADLGFITERGARGGWNYFFIDHGYNPPPTWTLIGGTLSELCSVERMKAITSIDALLVLGLMILIWRSYGAVPLVLSLLFFLVTFSGRWPILGQSILRFDWLVALVAAAAALKHERHGLAGACLAYAALIRIFPAIFFLAYAAVLLRDSLRARRLSAPHRRFILGAALCSAVLLGGAWAKLGGDAFRDSVVNLKLHGSPESYSSHRVGLGDVLVYQGEWSRKDMRRNGGIDAKRARLWELEPYLRLAGLVFILFGAVVAWRSREPVHRLLWLAIFPLFCLTNPQINYYNLRLLLVLYHGERWYEYRHKVSLYVLFAIEVLTQTVYVAGAIRYTVSSMTSIGLLLYLLLQVFFLVREQQPPAAVERPAT